MTMLPLASKLIRELLFMPAPFTIIFVIILRAIFKTKGRLANKALLIYALTLLVIWLIMEIKVFDWKETQHFLNRASGPYFLSFLIMIIATPLSYCLLLIKKLRKKTRWILLAITSLTIGAWFEMFVILVTSIHRDYLTSSLSGNSHSFIFPTRLIEKIIIGFIIGAIIYFIFEFPKRKTTTNTIIDA